ncbi:DUF4190 domain-containing protein [Kitasatospora sp. P5_F3]
MSNPYQQQPPDPYGYGPPQQPYAAPQYPQPMPQQPGYGYPQPPVPAPAPVPNNLAVAAMVLGFLSILICFYGALLGPVGLGLGIAGLNRARQTGTGRSQAIGGMVLSVLGILIGIAGVVFYSTVADLSENYGS